MPNWKAKIYLTELLEKHEEGKATVRDLADAVAHQIRALPWFRAFGPDLDEIEYAQSELTEIADGFDDLPDDLKPPDFDYQLGCLYDVADVVGLWVETVLPDPGQA